jgi:signal transduction histidine kinase
MRSANLGILVLDAAGSQLLFANSAARALLEGGGVAVDYASASAVFTPSDAALGLGGAANDSCRLGARLVGFTRYQNGPVEWVFCRDISDKARLEAIAEAIELTNSLGHVFSAVRHELGNPINSIKMALSVLRRNFDQLGRDATLEYLDAVLKEIERVSELLVSLRSFSLYEEVAPQPLELDRFLAELVELACLDYRQKGISLVLDSATPGVSVHADPRALRQVLLNLLANAADALAGQPGARVTLRSTAVNGVVAVTVRDNGPGIPPAVRERLFEPFVTTKPSGTGLGLVIARKMLARMSGTITIESSGDDGTSILLTLQRARS